MSDGVSVRPSTLANDEVDGDSKSIPNGEDMSFIKSNKILI